MKNLIRKEFSLGIPYAVYLFSLLSCLIIIPNYPYSVGFLYFFFPIMITFNRYKETKDLEFSSTLPLSRNNIVKSRMFSVILFEVLQLLIAIPFACLSVFVFNKQGNLIGIDANITLFAFTLIEFAVFNIVFIPMHFRSGYKYGWALVLGMFAFAITVVVLELLVQFIPMLKNVLDNSNVETIGFRFLALVIGLLFYVGSIIITYILSIKNFKKVDL